MWGVGKDCCVARGSLAISRRFLERVVTGTSDDSPFAIHSRNITTPPSRIPVLTTYQSGPQTQSSTQQNSPSTLRANRPSRPSLLGLIPPSRRRRGGARAAQASQLPASRGRPSPPRILAARSRSQAQRRHTRAIARTAIRCPTFPYGRDLPCWKDLD